VTRGAHERALDELRSDLAVSRQEAEDKDRSISALEAEREKLLGEIEDLRDARESLSQDVADREDKIAKLRGTYDALVVDLEAEVAANVLRIEQLTEGLSFRLPQDVLFPAGSADLTPAGVRAVREVASRIQAGSDRVEVQGHTDDRPIKGALSGRYPTNWELAGARAASVVRVLEQAGVGAERLSAVSFGPNRPLVSNDTAEGRAQNRRIEVRIVPVRGAEPLPAGEASRATGETPAVSEAPAVEARPPAGAGPLPGTTPPVEAGPAQGSPPPDEAGSAHETAPADDAGETRAAAPE
jgi:chemotaxis protein MotB